LSDLVGKTIGPYRLPRQIGVGGMATTDEAYQASLCYIRDLEGGRTI